MCACGEVRVRGNAAPTLRRGRRLTAAPPTPPPLQSLNMSGVWLGIGASADKMKKVMSEPSGRRRVGLAAGGAVLLFLLYLWLTR